MDTRTLLIGAATGAGLFYVLDPQSGRRRRALMRDKLIHFSRVTRDALDTTARDMANRTRGIVAATRAHLSEERVSDEVLVERVRSRLGRVCSHPGTIEVHARDGDVTLSGPVLAREVPRILSTVSAVRGVCCVMNELEPHEHAENVPALQGGGDVPGPSVDIMQRHWAPTTQALVAAAGLAAAGLYLASQARRAA